MGKKYISNISNAFSTGGGGVNFEQQVQAMFLLSLLVDGFCPAMNERTKRVCFQAKLLRNNVDDLAVFTYRNQNEGKLLCQIKHSITATENNYIFQNVICSAWSDFNQENFDQKHDKIALITSQISNSALRSLRFLHAEAACSVDAKEFLKRVQEPNFSSNEYRRMLNTIKNCVTIMKKNPSDEEIWLFCNAFILLLFDMDCEESINRALSASLIKSNSKQDAQLVWGRIFEYAGMCNQRAASIERNNFDEKIRELFSIEKPIFSIAEPIGEIDLFIPIIALIGAWKENNYNDRQIVEKISRLDYLKFEAKAKSMLLNNSEYLERVDGTWKVLHKEELLEQCKENLFDDCIIRLFEASKISLAQMSKRLACKTTYYISSGGDYNNSNEIRDSLVNSICWIKKNLYSLPNCDHNKTEGYIIRLVRDLLENADWITWASLGGYLQNLAEIAPQAYLNIVEENVLNKKQEILRLFPQKNINILNPNNYISELLWSIEVLAWSPEYLIKSVCVLGLLEALPYERNNWSNTPINSIVSILLPWYPQTLADFEKRRSALRCLKNDNLEVFWEVLQRLLPHRTTSTMRNPEPHYMPLEIPEEIKVTNAEVHECYIYLLKLAVGIVQKDIEKQIDLIDQIGYMDEITLSKYLECLEDSCESYTKELAFSVWIKLREWLIRIKPKEGMVIYNQKGRINALIEKLEPIDIRLRYQELYHNSRYLIEKEDYVSVYEKTENEKIRAIKEIFELYGVEETELFGHSVNNISDVASKLAQFVTVDELSGIIQKCSIGKVSKEFTVSCITSFISINGADGLLKSSLKNMNKEFILEILVEIPVTTQLLKVIKELLPDDSIYWKSARIMPFAWRKNSLEELKQVVEKLITSKRYVTAINIIGYSDSCDTFDAEYLCNLLRLGGTEESIGSESIDDYAVQKIIGWLQSQDTIDLDERSDIEFIYLPVLGEHSEVQPRALRTRISLEPDYFCRLLGLFYKKHSEMKNETQLNKGLNDRLYEILIHFKVTPGYDWNGLFHVDKFRTWMKAVKVWSTKNDRYEVAMETIGAGFAYDILDEDNLPRKEIIEELNKAENNELRRGYWLSILNQRGVHFVDPEGKPELELAKEYKGRADKAESRGYIRFAEVLSDIADHYYKEAEYNIASSQKGRN